MEGMKPMAFELMKAIVKTAGSGLREVILETHLYVGEGLWASTELFD
jgi:ribulose 1,5-bisphosphate synthetase/thiazole synthase